MKPYILLIVLYLISAKEESTNTTISDGKLSFLGVTTISRHSSKKVTGGDYVALEVDSYTKRSSYVIKIIFQCSQFFDKFYYKYKSSDSNFYTEFALGFFTSSSTYDIYRNGTECTVNLWWTRGTYKYLLLIPGDVEGENKMLIKNDEPLSKTAKIILYVVIGVLVLVFIIVILVLFKKGVFS